MKVKSHYNTESWRDDFDLEPNTHPAIAYALQSLRPAQRWPFPAHAAPASPSAPPPVEDTKE
jgi:hypothetical protein